MQGECSNRLYHRRGRSMEYVYEKQDLPVLCNNTVYFHGACRVHSGLWVKYIIKKYLLPEIFCEIL